MLGGGAEDELPQHLPLVHLYPALALLDEDDDLLQAVVVTESMQVGGDKPLLGRGGAGGAGKKVNEQ